MTATDHSVSTRHLVDRELAAPLDVLPPFDFTPETLPLIRERVRQAFAARPDASGTYPTATRSEHLIPGCAGDPDVRVVLYRSAHPVGPAPGLVWMHGGGFVLGSADDDDLMCRRIVTKTGVTVVSVDYRLAPETPAPGPVHDCYAALSWLYGSAAGLGVDRSRLAVGGASAGGGLAASLAVLARDRGEIPIGFQLLVHPMLDDRTGSTVDPHPYAGEFVWTRADNRFGWSAHLGQEPGGTAVSPYAAAARVASTSGLPPAFIAVGALDLFAEEDIAYATSLLRAGVPTELHVYPGAYHGHTMVPDARATRCLYHDLLGALASRFG